jgi:asparagine synthase (glutamine-hydrolysing)
MEFTAGLDSKFKAGKDILKKAFSKDLPKEISDRKKHGFDVPVNLWFNTFYKDKVDSVIESNSDILSDFFKWDAVKKMLNNKRDNLFLWRLYNFVVWYNKFMNH